MYVLGLGLANFRSKGALYTQCMNQTHWSVSNTNSNSKHMLYYLGSGNGVDEGGLLEAMVAGSDSHLPARVDCLIHHLARELLLCLAQVSLHIQLHIVLETLHLG